MSHSQGNAPSELGAAIQAGDVDAVRRMASHDADRCLFRTGRGTSARRMGAAGFYAAFAVALVLTLT